MPSRERPLEARLRDHHTTACVLLGDDVGRGEGGTGGRARPWAGLGKQGRPRGPANQLDLAKRSWLEAAFPSRLSGHRSPAFHRTWPAALASPRPGDSGSASRHFSAGPSSPRPPPGCAVGKPPSEAGSLLKPPHQWRRENQSHPSRGPQLHTKPPNGVAAPPHLTPGAPGAQRAARRVSTSAPAGKPR